MNFATVLYISAGIVGTLVIILFFYLFMMMINCSKKTDFPKTPYPIFKKYRVWYMSFAYWTFLEYFLILIPLFTSLATIYFTNDVLSKDTVDKSSVLLLTMTLLSALLPLINLKIMPKTHADGFYKGIILLENGMLKYEFGLISEEELIETENKAEKYTNPLAKFNEL